MFILFLLDTKTDGSVAQNITYREKHWVYVAAWFFLSFWRNNESEKTRNILLSIRKDRKKEKSVHCEVVVSHTERLSLDLEKELKW